MNDAKNNLNPISTELFYLVALEGGGGEGSSPFHKILSTHPGAMKLAGLIAYIMFYKICKFGNSAVRNDVIIVF